MVSLRLVPQEEWKKVRFVETHEKNPQEVLRQMQKNAIQNRIEKECMLCHTVDEVHPTTAWWCERCTDRLIDRYNKFGLKNTIRIIAKKPVFRTEICEHCHNKCQFLFQINILLCFRCKIKVNKKITESSFFKAPNYSIAHNFLTETLKKPIIKRPAIKPGW